MSWAAVSQQGLDFGGEEDLCVQTVLGLSDPAVMRQDIDDFKFKSLILSLQTHGS
jgi:hypothetical protein